MVEESGSVNAASRERQRLESWRAGSVSDRSGDRILRSLTLPARLMQSEPSHEHGHHPWPEAVPLLRRGEPADGRLLPLFDRSGGRDSNDAFAVMGGDPSPSLPDTNRISRPPLKGCMATAAAVGVGFLLLASIIVGIVTFFIVCTATVLTVSHVNPGPGSENGGCLVGISVGCWPLCLW